MEKTQSKKVEVLVKAIEEEEIIIHDTKEINIKGEEIKTTQYFLNVKNQDTNSENQETQYVTVEECDETHNQFVTVEVDESNPILIEDKDVILWNELCRICANSSDRFIPIFTGEGLEHNLCNKIHTYLPVRVSESDTLPLQLCYSCAATLLAWHEMSKGCLDAQQRLIDLQTKFQLKEQYYNESTMEEETVLEVETTANEESQIQDEPADTEQEIQVVDLNDTDRSKVEGRRYTKVKCVSEINKTVTSQMSRKKGESSTSVKKRGVRTLNKKKPVKRKNKGNVDVPANDQTVPDRNGSESDFSDMKLDTSLTVVNEDDDDVEAKETDENLRSTENSKSRRSGRKVAPSLNLECPECKKKFRLSNSYQIHMRLHTGEKPYTCHICGKQFGQTGSLYYHLKHVHGGVKNHACDICGRCFAMKTAMEDHRRIHTGERPYVCDSCGKTFKTKASLYIHSKIHTNEYPFKCSFCKKLFRWKQQMINHLTTHTGEKNHICDICGKGFGVKNELTRHRRTHSEEKPFTCQKCGVSFGQKRYLTNHNRTRHKIKPPQADTAL